jgi:hypothetical protein
MTDTIRVLAKAAVACVLLAMLRAATGGGSGVVLRASRQDQRDDAAAVAADYCAVRSMPLTFMTGSAAGAVRNFTRSLAAPACLA